MMESRPSPADVAAAVDLVVRLGSIMLSAGSPTDDVERSMGVAARALGLDRVTASVSFGSITLSYSAGSDAQPATAMQMVRERVSDYRRLSAAARLVNDLRTGEADRERAAAEVERIEGLGSAWPEPLTSLAQAVSASASTVLFGGSALDALATFVIGVLVQPVVVRLDRSGLPPFFRSLIGPLISTLLVAGAVAIGSPINSGLVMTGSLLRFLPGSALVAGMRDLIDQSIISGSARLAEALFLGAAVAVGTAIGTSVAAMLDISLTVTTAGTETYQAVIQVIAAGIACAAWAVRLGEPRFALLAAGLLGAVGWGVYLIVTSTGIGAVSATACAGLTVGAGGRILARRHEASAVLWVVPASLPLLPGLLIVSGMLAADAIDGLLLLSTAVVTGLVVGASVAFGDIVVQTLRQVREEIIQPVIIQPVVQVVHTRIGAVFGGRDAAGPSSVAAEGDRPEPEA
jgi:uncharacterized membrane protein YjjP (DUF1212 family)